MGEITSWTPWQWSEQEMTDFNEKKECPPLRTIAWLDNPEHPLYAKRLRFKLIYFPGKSVRHARKQILKFSRARWKEVQRMITAWAETRPTALARAG